jgi:predicted transposase/invertase (TIGR01784 family)
VDGVFFPPADAPDQTIFFVEVQFQSDPYFYHRLFAEIFLFLEQNPQTVDWQAVVLYPRRSAEPAQAHLFRSLLAGNQVQRLFLNELDDSGLGVGLVRLVVQAPQQATHQAKVLLEQVCQHPSTFGIPTEVIMELIETILVYKFPQYSRQEIAAILGMSDLISELKQTRVYRDALEEGLHQATRSLILRQLHCQFQELPAELQMQIDKLSLPQLERLGEALLDFHARADLENWLQQYE